VSAVKELPMEWEHETFGKRNAVERWFFYIKHRIKRFYENLCQDLDHLDTQKQVVQLLSYACSEISTQFSFWIKVKLKGIYPDAVIV